jgi:Lysozyme like domain
MTREDEHVLLVLLGLWAISRYSFGVVPAMENAGARLYDTLHNDAGHKNDLPGHPLPKEVLLQIATMVGFPNPKLATAIALAESGGTPNAIVRSSREYSVGLWQINTLAHPQYTPRDMAEPMKNAAAALEISKHGSDWRPWTAYTNGKYKQFLTGVLA